MRGDKARLSVWGLIAVAWALVLAERWLVNDNGGLIVAGASYLGVVLGARSAGIAKKSIVVPALPADLGRDHRRRRQSVPTRGACPGCGSRRSSGPVLGARTVLNPSPRKEPASAS